MSQSPTYTYLDYAASTPLDARVFEAMKPYFFEQFGNASSVHRYGQFADAAVSNARDEIARLFGAVDYQVVFTSGGTESDNLALRGILGARMKPGLPRILTTPVEHSAVLATAKKLAEEGLCEVDFLPVDQFGSVDPEYVRRALRPETALVSVIYANNEIGTINPIAEIGRMCRESGVLFHSDAVQAAAHLPINVSEAAVDLLSIGAHKFYGPKGVGALLVAPGVKLTPQISGGKQEEGLRAGTSSTPLMVGLATALRLTREEMEQRNNRLRSLRDGLIATVLERVEDAVLTGHPDQRLPNHASFAFRGADGNRLLMLLDAQGFACSSGSACKVGAPAPSEVLMAMGFDSEWTLGGLRVTLGRETTQAELERFAAVLPGLVEAARRKY